MRKNGIPDAISKTSKYRARKSSARELTPYGPLLQDIELQLYCKASHTPYTATVSVQHPMAMLWKAAASCNGFQVLMQAALAMHPPSIDKPWRVILYSDEVGFAPLQHDTRKTQAVYWSFAEFGVSMLSCEKVWFIMAGMRSDLIVDLEDGMSHLFKKLLHFVFDGNGHHCTRAGCSLQLPRDAYSPEVMMTVIIFAKLSIIVSDEKALKDTFHCNGASGAKPCMECTNATAIGSELSDHSEFAVAVNHLELADFKPATDASVLHSVRRVHKAHDDHAAGIISKAKYEMYQRIHGYSYARHNMLLDASLAIGAISVLMFDWMHVYLVSGMFNVEVFQLWTFLQPFGESWLKLHTFSNNGPGLGR